jgi:thiol-disulfide isomerase/thioredoxin
MNLTKYLLAIPAFLILTLTSGAQSSKPLVPSVNTIKNTLSGIHELNVGDKVPGIPLYNILNNPSSNANISDFGDGLIILDFMATSCVSCIELLPKLSSLQKAFSDRMKVFLITYENMDRVRSFLSNNKIGKAVNFPFIPEDTLLKKYFPYESISHIVWIYKGKVRAITNSQYLKQSNIESILKGDNLSWGKGHNEMNYDDGQVVFNFSSVPGELVSFAPKNKNNSVFGKYVSGVPDSFKEVIDSISGTVKVGMINMSIVNMFLKACDQSLALPKSLIKVELKDSSRFFYNSSTDYQDEWKRHNTFCYEAAFPLNLTRGERNEKIREDLIYYTGLNGRMQVKATRCFVLIPLQGAILNNDSAAFKENGKSLKKTTISDLIYLINHKNDVGFPAFNDSGFPSKTVLYLTRESYSNVELLTKELKKYNIDAQVRERGVNTFILSYR